MMESENVGDAPGERPLCGIALMPIVAGSIVLSWPSGTDIGQGWLGPAAIIGACLCWAVDNSLTRKVSASDALFIAGVALHLTERHEHEHSHEPLRHGHRHVHDCTQPHSHPHQHARLTHSHPHYPDIHHRHEH